MILVEMRLSKMFVICDSDTQERKYESNSEHRRQNAERTNGNGVSG